MYTDLWVFGIQPTDETGVLGYMIVPPFMMMRMISLLLGKTQTAGVGIVGIMDTQSSGIRKEKRRNHFQMRKPPARAE